MAQTMTLLNVREARLELACLAAHAPETCTSTNFAIPAKRWAKVIFNFQTDNVSVPFFSLKTFLLLPTKTALLFAGNPFFRHDFFPFYSETASPRFQFSPRRAGWHKPNFYCPYMRKIKVLVVDDHHLFRLGVVNSLQQLKQPQLEIVAECSNGVKAVETTMRLQPDLVLLDVHLPELDGIEVARQILQVLPKTRILALTASTDTHTILTMIKSGVAGYALKDIAIPELANAMITVAEGNTYYSKEASSAILASLSERDHYKRNQVQDKELPSEPNPEDVLTKREQEILRLVAEEKGNQEIAKMLYVSPRTVETHKRNILLKLKIKNVAGLVKYYMKHNGMFQF